MQNQLPTITEIKVNNRVVCEGQGFAGSVTKVSLQHTLQTSQTIVSGPGPTFQQPIDFYPPQDNYEPPPSPRPTKPPTQQQQQISTINKPGNEDSFQQSLPIFWQYVNKNPSAPIVPTTKKPTIPTRATTTTRPPTTTKRAPPPTTTTRPPTTTTRITTTTAKSTSTDLRKVCGQAALSYRPLVLGGTPIEKGSWPWLVALYINDPKSLSFNCGGNLISSRTVLTAAHCLKVRGVEYKAEHLLVVAGRYNLLDWSESTSRTSKVEKIIIHPDYDPNLANFDGDLAIMIVKQTIT